MTVSALFTATVCAATAVVATTEAGPVATAAPSAGPRVYAAVATANGREYLRLVDTRSGRVTATLASVKTVSGGYFRDIDLAPDGSVYAVTYDGSLHESYRTRLRRYTRKGAQALQPYILTVKVAPDGKSLATTSLSPDGDGDGYALETVRISSLKGTKVRDLMTRKVGVWKKGTPYITPGAPAVEAGGTEVLGWLPGRNLAVSWGCCDGGRSWVMSSTRKNQSSTIPPSRPTLSGAYGTTIIGYKGASVLQVQVNSEDHRAVVRWGTPRRYEGRVVGSFGRNGWNRADAVARRYGATPLRISPSTYPYRGHGTVTQASL